MSPKYIVGVDLGTSNCAVAFVEPGAGPGAKIQDLKVPQVIRPGEVGPRPLLPSALYLPAEGEFPEGSLKLPWSEAQVAGVPHSPPAPFSPSEVEGPRAPPNPTPPSTPLAPPPAGAPRVWRT
jgi:hypothetical protein